MIPTRKELDKVYIPTLLVGIFLSINPDEWIITLTVCFALLIVLSRLMDIEEKLDEYRR